MLYIKIDLYKRSPQLPPPPNFHRIIIPIDVWIRNAVEVDSKETNLVIYTEAVEGFHGVDEAIETFITETSFVE